MSSIFCSVNDDGIVGHLNAWRVDDDDEDDDDIEIADKVAV